MTFVTVGPSLPGALPFVSVTATLNWDAAPAPVIAGPAVAVETVPEGDPSVGLASFALKKAVVTGEDETVLSTLKCAEALPGDVAVRADGTVMVVRPLLTNVPVYPAEVPDATGASEMVTGTPDCGVARITCGMMYVPAATGLVIAVTPLVVRVSAPAAELSSEVTRFPVEPLTLNDDVEPPVGVYVPEKVPLRIPTDPYTPDCW